MKAELDAALCRDFPLLYRDRRAPMSQTCMCWGFPGDGWEPLIRRLSEKLEAVIAAGGLDCCASQVKEKFGSLCFYMTSATDEMYAWISEAEDESEHTCETCGRAGKIGGRGWLRAACEEHA